VTDANGGTATEEFVVNVASDNDLPTISDVANQSTALNTAVGPLAFDVGDIETAAGSLNVTASSSNLALIPNANIALGGGGANRTVTVTPAAGQSGTATITLTVDDENGGQVTDTFVVDVASINNPPTISDISNRFVLEGNSTGTIPFTVGDLETASADLV